jgi:hypothetical protein
MTQRKDTDGKVPVDDTKQTRQRTGNAVIQSEPGVARGDKGIRGTAEQTLQGEGEHGGGVPAAGDGREPRPETAVRKAPETAKAKRVLSPESQAYIRGNGKGAGVKIPVKRKRNTLQTAYYAYAKGYEDGYAKGNFKGAEVTREHWKQINDRTKRWLDEVNAKLRTNRNVYVSGIAIGVAIGTGITLAGVALL